MILLENGEVESEDDKDDTEDKEDLGSIFDEEHDSFHYPHQGPLLVAKRLVDDDFGLIFDEEDERLDTDLVSIFDEEDEHLNYPAHGPLLVTRRTLSVQPKTNEREQRENIFHSRFDFRQSLSVIIDGGSCTNVASDTLVGKLGFETRPLSRPFRLEWLNEAGE